MKLAIFNYNQYGGWSHDLLPALDSESTPWLLFSALPTALTTIRETRSRAALAAVRRATGASPSQPSAQEKRAPGYGVGPASGKLGAPARKGQSSVRRRRSGAISAGACADVSSREMEELSTRLAQERDRLTAILHSLGDGLCALDPEGRLLIINPEGERLLGWRQDELVGRDLLATVVAPPAMDDERPVASDLATLQELVGTGRAHRNEDGVFIRKDGALLPVSYVLTPLAHEGLLSGAVLASAGSR
jgi:PAS domain S-box-containing protein